MRETGRRKILQATSELLSINHIEEPAWYRIMATYPPPAISPRNSHFDGLGKPLASGKKIPRKPLKGFRPITISYPEDSIRSAFYRLHPWELAKPQTITEDEEIKTDSSERVSRNGLNSGINNAQECVDRQSSLADKGNMSTSEARVHVLSLYYKTQLYASLRRKVTQEEALHNGACFGKSLAEINFENENIAVDTWKDMALQRSRQLQQLRQSGDTECPSNP